MYSQPELDLKPEEVLGYSRKSQSDDPNLTVEEVLQKHEVIIDRVAEQILGSKLPEQNKFREVVSGGEAFSTRPEFQKILRMIESPRYRAILCVEPQRLTRGDLESIGYLMKLLKHSATLVITETRIYDLRDEYDWDAFERELKRGNEYLEYYKKIQRRGRLLSVSQGNYIGSTPPYGFDKITVMDGKRKCPTLKENNEQADVVRLIFDLYVNKNMGRRRIASYLDELGIKPPNSKQWPSGSLKEILTNVHYIGKVRWNWRKWVTIVDDGKFIKTRPTTKIGEYMVFEGRHQGIISEELFYAAQEKLGRNPRVKPEVKVRNPFVTLMFCKKCGKATVYKHAKDKEGNEKSPPRIMCSEQGRCGSGSCYFSEVLDGVCNVLEQCIEDFEIRIQNDTGDSVKLHARLIKNLEKKLEELKAKELSQWEAQSDPDQTKRMPHEIFQQLNAKLLKEKEEVQQALCKAYESAPEPVDYEEKVKRFKDALDALRDPTADAEKQNNLLKECIDRIEFYREKPQRINGKWNTPPVELDVKLRV
jgi:DNA invertase Pin-like site-specific DNA recombinase